LGWGNLNHFPVIFVGESRLRTELCFEEGHGFLQSLHVDTGLAYEANEGATLPVHASGEATNENSALGKRVHDRGKRKNRDGNKGRNLII